ncbi:MAG: hypothetical protein JSV43_05150 [Methanobacteriota archaeon]|nr:MAG: hypothetical protein JSV43_05150 [Euryarchaeota archaeon]
MDKGRLLYADRVALGRLNAQFSKTIRKTIIIGIALVMVFFPVFCVLWIAKLTHTSTLWSSILLCSLVGFGIGIIAISLGVISIISHRPIFEGLRIYENCISFPVPKGAFDYDFPIEVIPFSEISRIQIKLYNDKRTVLIFGEYIRWIEMPSLLISDIDVFVDHLKDKVRVQLVREKSE